MKRALFSQMKNEWASNLWLIIELAIVSAVILYLVWDLGQTIYAFTRPQPIDIEDVYLATIKKISEDSPAFVNTGTDEEPTPNYGEDILTLVGRLRDLDCVEHVAFGNNAPPYQYNHFGNSFFDKQDPDSVDISLNMRYVSAEYPQVLRVGTIDGKSPEQLSEILRKGEIAISISEYTSNIRKGDPRGLDLVGKTLASKYHDEEPTVGAIIQSIRRTDFEFSPWSGTALVPLGDNPAAATTANAVLIRVKHGKGADFTDAFYSSAELRNLRNISFLNLRPMTRDRSSVQDQQMREVRLTIAQIIMLLAIVFLGLLGTFWFRVQGRTSEIALRKVCGATPSQISRRLFAEGAIILTAALLIVAAFAGWIIPSYKEEGFLQSFFMYNDSIKVMWFSFAAGLALMYLLVAVGIWFPMRRAMKIRPAIALKQD